MRNPLYYLRVAFSVICGVACVLLLVTWLLSYRSVVSIAMPINSNRAANVDMLFGRAYLYKMDERTPRLSMKTRKVNSPKQRLMANMRTREAALGFGAFQDSGAWVLIIPQWFLVSLGAFLATLP